MEAGLRQVVREDWRREAGLRVVREDWRMEPEQNLEVREGWLVEPDSTLVDRQGWLMALRLDWVVVRPERSDLKGPNFLSVFREVRRGSRAARSADWTAEMTPKRQTMAKRDDPVVLQMKRRPGLEQALLSARTLTIAGLLAGVESCVL